MSDSLPAFNFCGFGEAGQRWLAQLKPDPLGGVELRLAPALLFAVAIACAGQGSPAPEYDLASSCQQVDGISTVDDLVAYLGEPIEAGVDKRVTIHGTPHQVEYHVGTFVGARASWAVPEVLGNRFVLHSVELSTDRETLYAHDWLGLSRAELISVLGVPVSETSDSLLFSCPPAGDPTTEVIVHFADQAAALVVFFLYLD